MKEIFQAAVTMRGIVNECLTQCLPHTKFLKSEFDGIAPSENSCQITEETLKINVNCARDNIEEFLFLNFSCFHLGNVLSKDEK